MQHKIQVNKTAIYHTEGNLKTAKTIWIVLHGYGMLAEFFIRKFIPILNEHTCIIAPEGLSKFYAKGFDGRVGATWMTKKDRASEIEDYINYLNQLYNTIRSENNTKDVKVNVVGFSQGGATACRWIANGKVTPTNFILWSSAFPDEMKFESFEKNVNTYLLYGDNDEFNTNGRINRQEAFLKDSQLHFKLIAFKGGHDIPNEILKEQTLLNNWQ
jgi:predicted esterase